MNQFQQVLENAEVKERHEQALAVLRASSTIVEQIQAMRFIRPIQHFKKTESGKVAILCNGASVLNFDPEKWGDYPTIGINGSWRIMQSKYHCIIDVKQLKELNSWWMRATGSQPFFKHLMIGLFWDKDENGKLKGGGSKYLLWRDLLFESCTEVASTTRELDGAFSMALDKYGAWLQSTPLFALQLAVYLGFEEIHFWGLDLVGYKFFAPWWKFWRRFMRVGNKQLNQPTAIVQNFHYMNAAASLRKYKPNVRIYNHNPDSACGAFEKVAV